MPDIVKWDGVEIGDIAKVDGIVADDIAKVGGQDFVTSTPATRWVAGGRLGYIFTTTASNGATGWSDGVGTGDGSRGGYIVDLGNGQTNSIAYGESGSATHPPVGRWMVGLELKNGSLGGTIFINSSSAHDDAGRPSMATSSNWTSASVPDGNTYISNGQLAYGNGNWVRGGKTVNYSGDYRNIGTGSNDGLLWTMNTLGNDINDYCRAVVHEGGTSDNWLALIRAGIWRSTDNGQTWTNLGEVGQNESLAFDWYSLAYDGAGRTCFVGSYGDGYTSIVPWADMSGSATHPCTQDWDEMSDQIGTAQNMFSIIYMKGAVNKWITVGGNGIVKTTAFTASARGPGDSWATPDTPTTQNLKDIATDHITAIAVGEGGTIWTSDDADDWTQAQFYKSDGSTAETERINVIACDVIGAGKSNG